MILVTVGTQRFPFDRLLKEVDILIANHIIMEKVVAQIGSSRYRPRYYEYVDYINEREFDKLLWKCNTVITHGGVGTITKGLMLGKKIIIVPRLKKYKEHVDDHQTEIAHQFSKMKYAINCDSIDKLSSYVKELNKLEFETYNFSYVNVAKFVENYLLLKVDKRHG